MLVFIIVASVILIFIVIRWNNRHKRELAETMKNNLKRWPVVGHAHYFLGSNADIMESFCKIGKESIRCGGSTCIWLFNTLIVMMTDPADTEVMLKTCLEKDESVNVFHELVGLGSIFAPVSIWRPRRKILASQFNIKRLLNFMGIYSKESGVLVDRLKSTVNTGTFSLWNYITAYTMDTIGETILGTKLNAQKHNNHPFPKAFVEFQELTTVRIFQPWLRITFIYKLMPFSSVCIQLCKLMNDFVKQLIVDKRQFFHYSRKYEEESTHNITDINSDRPKAMLESFIEAAEFTDVEMHEETLVLALAGTDTSAVGVSFTVLLLSRHKDVQEKLFTELQNYFGDSDNQVTGEDLTHLKYLDAVLKETLRLYPPVPLISRTTDQHLTLPSGRTLIPGVGVFINVWAIHRHPLYWGSDAGQFRPERFLEGELKHPAAYMPFSRGPRNCLGLQYASLSMKTALINLVRNYKFCAPPGDDSKILNVKYEVLLKHADNFRVKLEARH